MMNLNEGLRHSEKISKGVCFRIEKYTIQTSFVIMLFLIILHHLAQIQDSGGDSKKVSYIFVVAIKFIRNKKLRKVSEITVYCHVLSETPFSLGPVRSWMVRS